MPATKIIVLDDDPTGSQTVHSCLLLTRWDGLTLREALLDRAPLFFVLTNTRAMSAARAAEVTREVCRNIKAELDALRQRGIAIHPLVVSRSDSTLRGHYPVETDIIAEELGPFDAHFLVPAFFEGGRFTRDSVHYVEMKGQAIPAHETEFARDSVFAYRHSYLPDYVEEKTGGRILAADVERFLLDDVRGDAQQRLRDLHDNVCCVVDAEVQSDLDHFADQLKDAVAQGKRFLFRSGASLLTALAKLPPQPVPAEHMSKWSRGSGPGAVIVGSHVKKSTEQLDRLLRCDDVEAIEVDVEQLPEKYQPLLNEVDAAVARAFAQGRTPVIFTSRREREFTDQQARLAFGEVVSRFLMDVVRHLPVDISFLISKGGITSNDVLSSGLALRSARVLGQILPGCSVVRCPADHPSHPGMPVVIFPGNVGDDNALATAFNRLRSRTSDHDAPRVAAP